MLEEYSDIRAAMEKNNNEKSPLHIKAHDSLLKCQLSNSENFDRSILTLSSAALAISVTFLRGGTNYNYFFLLYIAWTGFGVAIFSTVVSYLISQKAIKRQFQILDDYYSNGTNEKNDYENPWDRWTNRCSYISATTFLLAIIAMLLYFANNLPQKQEGSPVSDKKTTPSTSKPSYVENAAIMEGTLGPGSLRKDATPVDQSANIKPEQPAPSTDSSQENK